MMYAIKTDIDSVHTQTFVFGKCKTMYGGKKIAKGDTIFIFASENEGGAGLIAVGIVTKAAAVLKLREAVRETPRVSVVVQRTGTAKRPLGRNELKPFSNWKDGRPETELNFKFYRQATNKIAGISDRTAAFLESFF